MLGKKTNKYLIAIALSALFISVKSTEVLADSKLPENKNKQIQFLEEKRKSQSLTIREIQKNAIVEGMMSSKDVEDRRNAEIAKENEVKKEQSERRDIASKKLKSTNKSQTKKDKSKQAEDKKTTNKTSRTNRYYKNTNIPIIRSTMLKADRIPLSEPSADNMIPGTIKDLLDKPVSNREPIDMDYSDVEMLERIVMAESGGEPYLGQVAVANVVLNRVKSDRYPSNLEGVIFQKSQFSPVKNGVIRGRAPNASVKKAVAEALNGRMIVPEDTLYFVNPVLATDQTIPRTKTPVKIIGNHTFYK